MIVENLSAFGQLSRNVAGSTLSYWKVGGIIDWTIRPYSPHDIPRIIKKLQQNEIPWAIIAGGSNLLISDHGYRGVIIHLSPQWLRDDEYHFEREKSGLRTINVPAWTWVPGFARTLMKMGVADLIHTCGIPGTLGGLSFMNGGSNRETIGTNIIQLHVTDQQGDLLTLSPKECGLEYRKNRLLSENGLVIISIDFIFFDFKKTTQQCRQDMLNVLASRRKRFPRKVPNCGSVFKSDPELYHRFGPPGRVIEELGLKGLKSGGAEISEHHGNFILNRGGATARDILYLINTIKESFLKHLGNKHFETEVKFLHETKGIINI